MGDDPNPALRKFPYEELAAKGGALKYKTSTAVPGTRMSGTRYVGIFWCSFFGELGVAGERTSRTSPQTFEQSSEKLCGDEDLP